MKTTDTQQPVSGWVFLWLVAAYLIICFSRFMFLFSAVGSVPFWDQWGAEGGILSAYMHGGLSLEGLLGAHNEHRILWTRLLNLVIFRLNGNQWDNAVEAIVSSSPASCIALH